MTELCCQGRNCNKPLDKKLLFVSPLYYGMEDSLAANITETYTVRLVQNSAMNSKRVHAEGTTEAKLQLPTETEVPSHNTVIHSDIE